MRNLSRLINIICIVIGGIIAIYANAEEQQNTYVLIVGIVLLMFGIYRTSRNVPSKFENQKEESFIQSDTSTPLSDQSSTSQHNDIDHED
ncbi:MAG: hypothetical protein ED556_06770 [Winogradskyella sp.]|uniref:hypothetical protein n=1 Tax=Winogradskyella sp. TaxID=1883156 RepID=UPI000F416AE5|nr:hypothetical protein [Winogradskyella sp.]RNC87122.1 MAG: hypothetical protein ED556_06770 [Winogradskyella sp.]